MIGFEHSAEGTGANASQKRVCLSSRYPHPPIHESPRPIRDFVGEKWKKGLECMFPSSLELCDCAEANPHSAIKLAASEAVSMPVSSPTPFPNHKVEGKKTGKGPR